MRKFLLLSLVLSSIFINTTTYAGDCTKDEILRFMDKGFSKTEINEICNGANKSREKSAPVSSNLTKKLMSAMTLNSKTKERVGDSGEAIRAYIEKGFLGGKPNSRADYTDYWVVNKPVDFMGHQLVLIEEEYMISYIGCCVSPGMGITVKVKGDVNVLKDFANTNKCSLTINNQSDFNKEVSFVGTVAKEKGEYATLSCRERDANY